MNAIIVDDEQDGRDVLVNMLTPMDHIKIVATASTVSSAYDAIIRHHPDLVFLDVEMSGEHGFDLLKMFEPVDFKVIFVTAYDKYAIKAIKFSALDYLLKPVDPDELLKAVQKVAEADKENGVMNLLKNIRSNLISPRLAIPSVSSVRYISLDEVIRFQAEGNYTEIFLNDGTKLVSTKLLKEYEDMVKDYPFMRVHRSHLICLKHVVQFFKGERNEVVMKDGSQIEISRQRKMSFLQVMNKVQDDF